MPGLIKVGHTARSPEIRAAELSAATGVPGRFAIAWAHHVRDHEALEGLAHGRLARYRVNNNREFFSCTVAQARRIIEQEARAQLLPWWRVMVHRLVHPLPAAPKQPTWQSAKRSKLKPWRRSRLPEAVIALSSAAFAMVVTFRPGWLPAWVLQVIAGLPHPSNHPQSF